MEALDRVVISHNWITIVFVFALLLLFVLKLVDPKKLIGHSKSFFTKGFIEKKAEEKLNFFSLFNLLIFVFSIFVISLSILLVAAEQSPQYVIDFSLFKKIFGFVFFYFLIFIAIDLLVSSIFQIQNEIRYLIAAKIGYLYNSAIWILPVLILAVYGLENAVFLAIIIVALFILSTLMVVLNNKKLIVNQLFYFILYICALEIAPLLIFYKITI